MFQLLRLTLRQKKLVILSFACALFVALFTSVQISLVQPIIDEMFKSAPAVTPSRRRARLLESARLNRRAICSRPV